MRETQLSLPLMNPRPEEEVIGSLTDYRERLVRLLKGDLDFHGQDSQYSSHNFHAFPAKFPPQLPQKFIQNLTQQGDFVLDPMCGSGTTVLEACLNERTGIGIDIDPLARMISKVKTTPFNKQQLAKTGFEIIANSRQALKYPDKLSEILTSRWDRNTRKFIDYWFTHNVQLELLALLSTINNITNTEVRDFYKLVFSAIIITKSGGVSLALDLAHTRPHRAKIVIDPTGEIIEQGDPSTPFTGRVEFQTKNLRSPIEEFEKRLVINLSGILKSTPEAFEALIMEGDARSLPLENNKIDLIVTSPPYASNAIDYMRAHKFSLVWLGLPIDHLGSKRKEYIGGEAITEVAFEELPKNTQKIVSTIRDMDPKKGQVLHRYYSEMTLSLKEIYRVLKPGKSAIVVVGSSTMREIDTQTQDCLAEIGETIGFDVPGIGVRKLDRNKRMMPAGKRIDHNSQIQQRMHEEFVIGFLKPEPPAQSNTTRSLNELS